MPERMVSTFDVDLVRRKAFAGSVMVVILDGVAEVFGIRWNWMCQSSVHPFESSDVAANWYVASVVSALESEALLQVRTLQFATFLCCERVVLLQLCIVLSLCYRSPKPGCSLLEEAGRVPNKYLWASQSWGFVITSHCRFAVELGRRV